LYTGVVVSRGLFVICFVAVSVAVICPYLAPSKAVWGVRRWRRSGAKQERSRRRPQPPPRLRGADSWPSITQLSVANAT